MKILFYTLLFLCMSVHIAEARTARVFILSGQSNAFGNGNGDLLTEEQAAENEDLLILRNAQRGWEPLRPVQLKEPKEKFQIERSIFGTEISFAKRMKEAYPDDIIAICKVGVSGGTSIFAWEKDHSRPGWEESLKEVRSYEKVFRPDGSTRNLYQEIIDSTKAGLELLKQREDVTKVILCGMSWIQGEADGRSEQASNAYGENLASLISNVRQDLDTPDLIVLFQNTHIQNNPRYRGKIRESMQAIVARDPLTGMVENNDLPTYEGIHFTTEGIWELGRRFAETYLGIVAKQN